MGTPKKRKTKAGRNQRRSHHALKSFNLSKCGNCGHSILAHHACLNCGSYNGKEMISVLKKLSKKETEHTKKKKEDETKTKSSQQKEEIETKGK